MKKKTKPTRKRPVKSTRVRKLRTRKAGLFVLLFAVVGTLFVLRSLAQTDVLVSSVEAESLAVTDGVRVQNDPAAKNGAFLYIPDTGTASGDVALVNPTTKIIVRAKGTSCKGSPELRLSVGGQVYTASVGSQEWTDVPISASVPAGTHPISVSMTAKQFKNNRCAQDISVGSISFYAVATTPAPIADTSAPSVTITAPLAGATLTNTLVLAVTATDNVGVKQVEYAVDGTTIGTVTAAPFTLTWDTKTVANGSHTLTAKAYDAAGNASASSPVTINVSNVASVPCTRYVSTGGNDAASGLSSTPWRSIKLSLDKLRAGDTLCIRTGTYAEEVRDSSLPKGSVTAPIALQNYPGERVVIDGAASFSDPDYWVFKGIEWTNPTPLSTSLTDSRVVTIVGGSGWTFRDNHIYGSTYAGLLVGKSSTYGAPHNSAIRNNIIRDTSKVNFYFNPGRDSTGMLIERNLLFNSGTENLKLGWGGTDSCTTSNMGAFGVGEVTVRYNTMHGSTHYGLIVAEPAGLGKIDVYKNIISGAPNADVRYDNTDGCLGSQVFVHDNIGAPSRYFSIDFDKSPVSMSNQSNNRFPLDPKYDSLTAGGFRPQDLTAKNYGRYAP